jgi:uncharacterized protein YxjI
MPGLLDRDKLFVREHVGMFKARNAYDLLDPVSQAVVGRAEEKVYGFFRKLMKFTSWKTMMSFTIYFHDASAGDATVLTVHRPFTWFRSVVSVTDASGRVIGRFRQKLMAIGPKMWILDAAGNEIGMLKGDWIGWNLQVVDKAERPLATITKKWAGVGKELFTSADNYMIDLSDEVRDADMRRLLFAAPITADMVYKEYKG